MDDDRSSTAEPPSRLRQPDEFEKDVRQLFLGPPGRAFYLAVAVAVVLAVDANTRQSLGMLILAAPVWLAIAAIWAIRFVFVAFARRFRLPAGHWLRWLGVPVVMAMVFAVTRTDVLIDARLALSRNAMSEMAADVLAGGSTDRAWVGIYPVDGVQRTPSGVMFVVDGDGLSRHGFVYAADGRPGPIDEQSGLWCCESFSSIGDGWYRWSQGWD